MKTLKTLLTTLTLMLVMASIPASAQTPLKSRYPEATVQENAPRIFITNSPEIQAAFDNLWKNSPSFHSIMRDIYLQETLILPVYAASMDQGITCQLIMAPKADGANIYLDRNQIKLQSRSLTLVLAAQIKTFHETFVEHAKDPKAYYIQMLHDQMGSPEGQAVTRARLTANKFAERVRFELQMPEQSSYPVAKLIY